MRPVGSLADVAVDLVKVAMGAAPADTVIRGGRVVNRKFPGHW